MSTVQIDTRHAEELGRQAAPGIDCSQYQIIRRNGSVAAFEPIKISTALAKAFLATRLSDTTADIRHKLSELTETIVVALMRRKPDGGNIHIEDVQDQVELSLMRVGEHDVARAYVLYRENRARERSERGEDLLHVHINMTRHDGRRVPLDISRLKSTIVKAADGLDQVNVDYVLTETMKTLYDGVSEEEVGRSAILAARSMIEQEPQYDKLTARLLMGNMRLEVLGEDVAVDEMPVQYPVYFVEAIRKGIKHELLDRKLAEFDLRKLARALKPERDLEFNYLGLQTLYDRYFLHVNEVRIELPQVFFMRVAMGLALNEADREARAIEFYDVLSSFDFMSSTPTLFNSGTRHSQLSSCYLSTIADALDDIYDGIKANALLSKFAGGLGNDWTPVRAMGAHIKGTNGKSQGVIPFLKVVNDTAVAVNQCFAPDTKIYTADGTKPIRALTTEDLVLTADGTYSKVQKVLSYVQPRESPMVSILCKHALGEQKVTSGHPLYVASFGTNEDNNERRYARLKNDSVFVGYKDAGELTKGDWVGKVIPTEIIKARGMDDDWAYLYGVVLGDGYMSDHSLTIYMGHGKAPALAKVKDILARKGITYKEDVADNMSTIRVYGLGGGVVQGEDGRLKNAGGQSPLPFGRFDVYNAAQSKKIASRFMHLPLSQTANIIAGLVATDGHLHDGKNIVFYTASEPLAEGVQYLCLRLKAPVSGKFTLRNNKDSVLPGLAKPFSAQYVLRIPAVEAIAEVVGISPVTKKNWVEWKGKIYSRIKEIKSVHEPIVYDLIVDGNPSYMTHAVLAHNGGKRKGAVCAYLETWHADIEEFLELRKNTGDDRRRTHDMNTANWIPDLFMERVMEGGNWSLFSPDEMPELHDLYGSKFATAYREAEQRGLRGELRVFKQLPALQLWRKMLTMLFETGHPWITFKDPCNLRNPQQHVGVVHSSNLCTEITLNTDADEIAVCNLGSVNLTRHMVEVNGVKVLDTAKLERTIRTGLRMLDNVIDINFYPVPEARRSNLRHRPVGMGIMGFQDTLYAMGVAYGSEAAVQFADSSMEHVAYYAYLASAELARERGRYSTYEGSLWSQGILPQDSMKLLAQARFSDCMTTEVKETLDWSVVREAIARYGMRNSNVLAIAPTATIANIVGVSPSIEPTYQNLYVKSNLSGEFTVANKYLVDDLKALGLWDDAMVRDLKFYDGSVMSIDRVPAELKRRYATSFEIEPTWLVDAAARRQIWIDQAQSLNLYVANASGRKLDELYRHAWKRGLKTTYYLRTLGATSAEKSTGQGGELNAVSASAPEEPAPKFCAIDNPDCEACQ